MKKNQDQVRVFTRRAFVIAGLQGALLGVLGGRLAWLQISQGARYKTLSDKNRINLKVLSPVRGEIVDRFGVPLAVNAQNFRALIIPEQAADIEQTLRRLQEMIELSEDDIQAVLKEAGKTAKFVPIEITDDLSWKDVAKIEVNLPDLPGLSTDAGKRRTYPFKEATAHLVGYVGAVSKNDVGDDPALSLPGFKIGKTGIEKRFDLEMRGSAGQAEVEVNVVGREVRELKKNQSRNGKRITLTIDGELQRFMQGRLSQEKSASAVVMDAHSGAVYALASAPSFDPNAFTSRISAAFWEELLANPAHPLTNKAVSGQYPPASTFKMISLLAGLQAGAVTENTTAFCKGHYELGSDRFHCWKRGGHGWVDCRKALQMSCDVYFYELATKVGIDKIAQVARMMGLGQSLDFELTEERAGLVPDKAWKRGKIGQKWQPGETVVASIGQGYLQATPLQLAVMTARLVNGGYAVKPWVTADGLAKNIMPESGWPKLGISPEHLSLIKTGMDRVVNDEKGTAYGSRADDPALAFGGKTGTGQVQRITMKQRMSGVKNEELQWKSRHHALFVGYAPLENPRYIASVVVEHGIGGSRTAAPLARDLLVETQKRNPGATPVHGQAQGAASPLKAKEPA
ncbi:MAG: penicillin-binding protein 2 [Rhodospirillales bacterium]|nr:penicillin-binding protein 2 [Rhodospirillales bacterium]